MMSEHNEKILKNAYNKLNRNNKRYLLSLSNQLLINKMPELYKCYDSNLKGYLKALKDCNWINEEERSVLEYYFKNDCQIKLQEFKPEQRYIIINNEE